MTYAQLLEKLKELTPEQLNKTLTVNLTYSDEYYPAEFDFVSDSDVLDDMHPVFTISA